MKQITYHRMGTLGFHITVDPSNCGNSALQRIRMLLTVLQTSHVLFCFVLFSYLAGVVTTQSRYKL